MTARSPTVILGGAICLSLVLRLGEREAPAAAIEEETKLIELAARLDKTIVEPGERVRLTVTIQAKRKVSLRSYINNTRCIGKFDRELAHIRLLAPEDYETPPQTLFGRGLPSNRVSSAPMALTVTNPREQGLEYEFYANYVGTFMIQSSWGIDEKDDFIYANPVTLTVMPPADDKGNYIIKDEWLYK
jgi:hypothetical protein